MDIVPLKSRKYPLAETTAMENAFLLAPSEAPTQIFGRRCRIKCFIGEIFKKINIKHHVPQLLLNKIFD